MFNFTFHISHFTEIFHFSFFNEKMYVKHVPSLKIVNCKLINRATGGRD